MSGVGPVAGLEQNSVERPDLHDLAGDSIDFHPIAEANAIFPHRHKPAEKADDEILQCDSEPGASQAKEGSELPWWTESHEENQEESENLQGDPRYGAKGLDLVTIHGKAIDHGIQRRARENTEEHNREDDGDAQERAMQHVALVRRDELDPLTVNRG